MKSENGIESPLSPFYSLSSVAFVGAVSRIKIEWSSRSGLGRSILFVRNYFLNGWSVGWDSPFRPSLDDSTLSYFFCPWLVSGMDVGGGGASGRGSSYSILSPVPQNRKEQKAAMDFLDPLLRDRTLTKMEPPESTRR